MTPEDRAKDRAIIDRLKEIHPEPLEWEDLKIHPREEDEGGGVHVHVCQGSHFGHTNIMLDYDDEEAGEYCLIIQKIIAAYPTALDALDAMEKAHEDLQRTASGYADALNDIDEEHTKEQQRAEAAEAEASKWEIRANTMHQAAEAKVKELKYEYDSHRVHAIRLQQRIDKAEENTSLDYYGWTELSLIKHLNLIDAILKGESDG